MSDAKLSSTQHRARPGDHLGRVAAYFGFKSYASLWNDTGNADLRAQRHNPNILAQGDWIYVPKLELREVDRATEQRHRFRAELHPLELRLVLQSPDGKPSPDKPTDVVLDGKPIPFDAPAPGRVTVVVEPMSDRCLVRLAAREIVGRIGFLEPVSVVAGYRARLTNLGYDAGENDDPKDSRLRSAVEEFQCDHGLVVDGKCGRDTQARLAAVHGC